jgi:methyl-accepting chemotaxis protein
MVAGKTDYRPFRKDGVDYFVFFKPFQREVLPGRADDVLGWSAGIIYPKDDIFGDSNRLSSYVIIFALVGLLLLFALSCLIIHRQLKPLLLLASSAQRIAKGNYDEMIPDSHQADEVGQLQDTFQLMQLSLGKHVRDLEQLTATLEERGIGLRAAYNHAQKADRMKTAFLHNMTNQMVAPADALVKDVASLAETDGSRQDVREVVEDILRNSDAIAAVLKNVIDMSENDMGKEGDHA